MQISKWGNSLAVRLPAALADKFALEKGDAVKLEAAMTGTVKIQKMPDLLELIDELRRYEGLLPKRYRFRRSDAYRTDANE